MNFIEKKSLKKKIIIFLGVFVLSGILLFNSELKAEAQKINVLDQLGVDKLSNLHTQQQDLEDARLKKKEDEKNKQNIWSRLFHSTLGNALNKLAYDAATWIGSGGEGQKPMFITEGWGAYLSNIADSAAGNVL